ncbi:hypothetical protein [Nocardia arthritidis]|uniref:4'-phosphopantetheinyl transferase superfamily protein n=1 Tax=Nocardia arthritidis TaxID=228602 RepID=A0A6G9YEU4_9NOCA|nr:hypothetical protein [Nocardia arthritidis]QIS11597.1 hypothetical protein F5544_18630 [Nocardia arthritidis]
MNVTYEICSLADLPGRADPLWREWLTAAELAYCNGFRRVEEHLAVRLLAKRAAARALDRTEVPWTDLAVLRSPDGPPRLVARGELDRVPGISLTHAGGHAAAIAWLTGER